MTANGPSATGKRTSVAQRPLWVRKQSAIGWDRFGMSGSDHAAFSVSQYKRPAFSTIRASLVPSINTMRLS